MKPAKATEGRHTETLDATPHASHESGHIDAEGRYSGDGHFYTGGETDYDGACSSGPSNGDSTDNHPNPSAGEERDDVPGLAKVPAKKVRRKSLYSHTDESADERSKEYQDHG